MSLLLILKEFGYKFPAGILPFDANTPRFREVYRISRFEDEEVLMVDFLLVSRALQHIWDNRKVFEVGGRTISCVSLDGLMEMKRLAGRPRDLDDIQQLNERDG